MDNPDRPPEPICAQHADDPDSMVGDRCDEPETIERDADELVKEAIYDYLWLGIIGPVIMWILGTIVLFSAGRLAGGHHRFSAWSRSPGGLHFRNSFGLESDWAGFGMSSRI